MRKLKRIARACGAFGVRRWQELSTVGLILGIFCFAASLTPSLLPRRFPVQGALSGVAFAVGYAVGRLLFLTWQFLEIPLPPARLQRVFKWSISIAALVIAVTSSGPPVNPLAAFQCVNVSRDEVGSTPSR